jgi:hypothetical protein
MTGFWTWSILKEKDLKKRAKRMEFLIDLAYNSIEIKDPANAISIFSALNNGCLHRLKLTINALSSKHTEKRKKIEMIISAEKGYKNLRELQIQCKEVSCYFGIFFTGFFFYFLLQNFNFF